jgi:hypothetical protein
VRPSALNACTRQKGQGDASREAPKTRRYSASSAHSADAQKEHGQRQPDDGMNVQNRTPGEALSVGSAILPLRPGQVPPTIQEERPRETLAENCLAIHQCAWTL